MVCVLSFSFGVVMERCGCGGILQTCFVQARVNIECEGIFLLKSLAVECTFGYLA
jgi:hypothetical protein